MPITMLALRNAKPAEKPYKMADSGGLFLLVNKTSRRWQMKYRWEGKEKLLSFGVYDTVGLADARQRRDDAKRLLAAGIDPAKQKMIDRDSSLTTFETIARQWHDNRKSALVEAHASRVLSRMEADVFPALGGRLIGDITAAEVLAVIQKVEARGAIDVSKRLKQCMSRVFRFASAHGWATSDPTANLGDLLKPKPRVQNMARLPLSELPTFLTKLDAYQGEEITKLALRFTLLTWARTSETRLARWEEFEGLDTDRPVWRVPAERMKMDREHLVPLSPQAVAVIRQLAALPRREWVFPQTRKPMLPLSSGGMISACYRLGYRGRQTVHGLRGMASTWANEADIYKPDWIEVQLSHGESDTIRAAYNSAEYITQRTAMMNDWGNYVAAADDEFSRLLLG